MCCFQTVDELENVLSNMYFPISLGAYKTHHLFQKITLSTPEYVAEKHEFKKIKLKMYNQFCSTVKRTEVLCNNKTFKAGSCLAAVPTKVMPVSKLKHFMFILESNKNLIHTLAVTFSSYSNVLKGYALLKLALFRIREIIYD